MLDQQLVIFDLDGTLVKFHHDYLFSQALELIPLLGHPPVELATLQEAFEAFDFFRFVNQTSRQDFTESFWDRFDWDNFPTPVPLPGALELLSNLNDRGQKTAIATARLTESDILEQELTSTGFLPFLSLISTREGEHIHWADKRSTLLRTCRELDIAPQNAIMVGDIPTDITSAKDVGIGATIAVRSGGIREDILLEAEPTILVDSVAELLPLLIASPRFAKAQ